MGKKHMIGCHEVVMCHSGSSCVFPMHTLLPWSWVIWLSAKQISIAPKINHITLKVEKCNLFEVVFAGTICSL